MKGAIDFHLEGMRTEGEAVPEPSACSTYVEVLGLDAAPKLVFEEGLDQERQEVETEEGLDAGFVLEEHGREFEAGLGLLEALPDRRLAPVGAGGRRRRPGSRACGRW